MFSRWRTIRQTAWPRRLTGAVLVLSVCTTLIPLPSGEGPSVGKELSEPFPCQDRPCGCRSAEQCWKKCCCFTQEQKLAWARRQRVSVPLIVLERPARRDLKTSFSSWELSWKTSSCCDRRSPRNRSTAETGSEVERDSSAKHFVIGVLVQQCQGAGLTWNSLPWTVVPDPLTLIDVGNPTDETPRFRPHLPAEVCIAPPVPPPRQVACSLLAAS